MIADFGLWIADCGLGKGFVELQKGTEGARSDAEGEERGLLLNLSVCPLCASVLLFGLALLRLGL